MKRLWECLFTMTTAATIGMATPAASAADARLQQVLKRLDAGQPIMVAAIGGSITTGYAANPPRERGWAAQVAARLGRWGPVRFINAGVSGTDSAAAVQRLQSHVLDAEPDLVFVEFGVNDQWLDERVRAASYEALLRRLLSAPKPPAVVPLMLTQQGNRFRDAVDQQLRLAAHYGLTAVDFGQWMQGRVDSGQGRWEVLYDEPVHPNQRGHDTIAQAVIESLEGAMKTGAPAVAAALPEPLHARAREYEHVRHFAGDDLKPWRHHGFVRGGEVHPEWAQLPGGQVAGWTTTADDAQASFLVWGREVAVFHAESERYRNLEAWVDDGPVVTLRGQVPERVGYIGWHYTVVGTDLEPGAHLLHVRVKRDEWAGSGRSASLVSVMGAGLLPPALHPSDFVRESPSGVRGWRFVTADDARWRTTGRTGKEASGARLLAWSGTELRARFTGTQFALRFAPGRGGINHFTVEVDGRPHMLSLRGEGLADWRLREPLPPGEHSLRIVKRTEGAMAEAVLHGLLLGTGGQLLAPPPARPLKLEFYGDSITAGACNGDMGEDQYEDLSSHDGTRAYGALTAQRLGADYVGIAFSGIGITRTWGEFLMPQVWNRVAPWPDAPEAPRDAREPDVVLVNLGQNDHGFPASRGEPFAADFAERYLAFVRQLRQRYPATRLVLLAGGMTAWKEQPAIPQALAEAVRRLKAEGDAQVWTYTFQAFSWAHPRIDVHAQMADELVGFLKNNVLP
ncbi:GDSL-type esterase/lipase family protein [Ideonella sp.]|uniref:GDSL-type esterase/lipase family protein n=1 Tax=Ideonella sp. TaxID=1929293 RepID=UPI002B4A3BED|nr:GDSL-type esterase/lipase family protein [Ideonella sp.]HJV69895.1 GDSL-type esterase/lipase family protein [Ideonella sp.]